MEERIFFEYEGVKITNARFVVDGQTYAMSNITSVQTKEERPSRLLPGFAIMVGLASLLQEPAIGVAVIAAAAYWLYKQKTTYHVVLRTAAGEASALKTFQREYLNKVVSALNDAIVHRG